MAMNPLSEFIRSLIRFGMEYYHRYYGPYRAIVTDNKDPVRSGRIQVQCPRARIDVGNGHWLWPMTQGGGLSHGGFWPPEIGDTVWIFFDNGDPRVPFCYMGGWYPPGKLSADLDPGQTGNNPNPPKKRGFVTPGGHEIILDDTSGSESVLVKHKNGEAIQITSNGEVMVGNVNGTFEPMMKGTTVSQWLSTHTHGHAWGPTSPPLQPFPTSGLSTDTKTS